MVAAEDDMMDNTFFGLLFWELRRAKAMTIALEIAFRCPGSRQLSRDRVDVIRLADCD